ncbi:MAG TPA: TonB-dependent receptor plug domain-containing protein, partial [Longimicrobium sp.]
MRTLFPAVLALALFAPAAQGQTDSMTARRDTVVPGAARLAAAKTIPELLAAQVPGLQVRPGSGAVASGSRLRLRGASGILVPGEPLVVVDGVRAVSEPNDLLAGVDQAPSRLDDFIPDDV